MIETVPAVPPVEARFTPRGDRLITQSYPDPAFPLTFAGRLPDRAIRPGRSGGEGHRQRSGIAAFLPRSAGHGFAASPVDARRGDPPAPGRAGSPFCLRPDEPERHGRGQSG
jgi:hypothetical protein